ncbi:MAG: substrate-binding domain-containing protein [Nevskia sp.]|nr:substrate-binding domain-containing protein [Nevskia sp.]
MKRNFVLTQKAKDARALGQAAVLAMLGAVSAAANAQTIYGGGATLPAVGYVGTTADTSSSRLTNPVNDSNSLFANVGSFTVSYCQTGSGTGKKVLGKWNTFSADNTCPAFSSTPFGFSAPSGQTLPDFAASDAPLSQTEFSSVVTNASSRGEPVQFPAVAGAIGILYNNSSLSGTQNLTDAQVCAIFAGSYTNWNQISSSYASKALTVIYRSDGSGTTFSMSNHLSQVCTLASGHFVTDQTFTTVDSVLYPSGLPSNFTGASGNPGVVTAVGNTDGAIAYGEIADANARVPTPLAHFTVNSKDPVTDLASPFTVSTTTGQVITGANATTGRPTLGAVSGGSHTSSCLYIVTPDSYANPSGYPIVAVSNLLGYYQGNGSNTTYVQQLLSGPYNSTVQGNTFDIGSGTGLSFLNIDLTSSISSCVKS